MTHMTIRIFWKPQRLAHHIEKRGTIPSALKRRRSMKKLVEEYSECPPIHRASVPLAANNLRREILVSSDERHWPDVRRLRHELRETAADHEAEVGFGFAILFVGEDPWEEAWGLHAALDLVVAVVYDAGGGADVCGGGFDEGGADGAAEGEVEIGEHDVAFVADEDVLWF